MPPHWPYHPRPTVAGGDSDTRDDLASAGSPDSDRTSDGGRSGGDGDGDVVGVGAGRWDRRRVLRAGAGGMALAAAAGTVGMVAACSGSSSGGGSGGGGGGAATAQAAWPAAQLPASAATAIDAEQFLSTAQLADLGAEADRLGLRATGAANHEGYLQRLVTLLRQAGVSDVALEPVPLRQWLATSWSLTADGSQLPNTFYAPYTRPTGPEGITAPLVHLPLDGNDEDAVRTALSRVPVRGKIVVFDVLYTTPALEVFQSISYPGAFHLPPGDPRGPKTVYRRPGFNTIPSTLDILAEAGAVGTVGIWTDLPGRWARQYTPYDAKYRPIPGLWIDRDAGVRLRELAGNGASATIRLTATIQDVTTHNVVGFIPGRSSELTVLQTHTDGTNGIEENGPVAILGVAQYLARLPQSARARTIMVLLSTGHFAGGLGSRHFLTQHERDLVPRISSVLTLEHLGTREMLPAKDGSITATGQTEFGIFFSVDSPGLVAACTEAVRRDGVAATVAKPFYAAPPGAKQPIGWPGEGTLFWWWGGLPTANYITGPYPLIAAGMDTSTMVDNALLRREALTSVSTVLRLADTPSTDLRVTS